MARDTRRPVRRPFFDELFGYLRLIVSVVLISIILAERGSYVLRAASLVLGVIASLLAVVVLAAALGGVAIVAAMVVQGVVLPRIRVVRCPGCKVGAMERVPSVPSGFQYHSCSRCGGRWKRLSPEDVWVAASGPEDDEACRPEVVGEARRGNDRSGALQGAGAVWDRWLDG
jgi:hypothetical protein